MNFNNRLDRKYPDKQISNWVDEYSWVWIKRSILANSGFCDFLDSYQTSILCIIQIWPIIEINGEVYFTPFSVIVFMA